MFYFAFLNPLKTYFIISILIDYAGMNFNTKLRSYAMIRVDSGRVDNQLNRLVDR